MMGVTNRPAEPQEQHADPRLPLRAYLPIAVFSALYVLVYAGELVKYGFLLIYTENTLHIPATFRGAVIGIQPLIELLIMPFSVALGRRFGVFPMLTLAAAMGLGANLCFVLWPSVAGMFAGQILMGGVWGLYMVLGLFAAQRLLPGAVATASAIFMSSNALSSALGGLAGGLGVAAFGLPGVFWLPAGFALLAMLGLAVMARRMG
jgi:SET family sugar efflux transporter-like MFS transporter